jgi:hypothetical protein
MAVSGVLAFFREFSLTIIGLHAIAGFIFIILIGCHATNNRLALKKYFSKKQAVFILAACLLLVGVLLSQPAPVRALLGLSGNLGPAQTRFSLNSDGAEFNYSPDESYKMKLDIKWGAAFEETRPPQLAIWLQNQGTYHIKTLYGPESGESPALPYWSFKRRGWEQARKEDMANPEQEESVDGISEATPNGSFDPADYILPADPDNPMPYKLLFEINLPDVQNDDIPASPSIVYEVEIDNTIPFAYQTLTMVGYPKPDSADEAKETWSLYFVDEDIGPILDLVNSALLTIDRDSIGR